MDRRKALTIAGTLGVTIAAATGAVAANVSLLGSNQDDPNVGQLDAQSVAALTAQVPTPQATTPGPPIEPEPTTTIVYVDEYVPLPAGQQPTTPPGAGSTVADPGPGAATPAPPSPVAATQPTNGAIPAAPAGVTAAGPVTGHEQGDEDEYEYEYEEEHDDEDEHQDEHEEEHAEWEGDDD